MTKLIGEVVNKVISDIIHHEEIQSCDWIIPVPLHKKRQKQRGFNQSFLFSKEIKKYLPIGLLDDVLVRNRNTKTQTLLNATEREENVKNAFEVKHKSMISGCNILLVDDLLTTGATANECAKVLKNSSSGKVFVLVLARP